MTTKSQTNGSPPKLTAAQAAVVVLADLLPETGAYCDVWRGRDPILVIQTGPAEIQLSMPGDLSAVEGMRILNMLSEAIEEYKRVLVASGE